MNARAPILHWGAALRLQIPLSLVGQALGQACWVKYGIRPDSPSIHVVGVVDQLIHRAIFCGIHEDGLLGDCFTTN